MAQEQITDKQKAYIKSMLDRKPVGGEYYFAEERDRLHAAVAGFSKKTASECINLLKEGFDLLFSRYSTKADFDEYDERVRLFVEKHA